MPERCEQTDSIDDWEKIDPRCRDQTFDSIEQPDKLDYKYDFNRVGQFPYKFNYYYIFSGHFRPKK